MEHIYVFVSHVRVCSEVRTGHMLIRGGNNVVPGEPAHRSASLSVPPRDSGDGRASGRGHRGGIGKRTPGGHREEWHRNHGRPGGGMQKPGSGPMSPMSPMSPLAKASSHPPTVTSRRPRAWIRGSPGSRAGSTCPRWPPRCSPRTCGRARGRIPGVPPRGCPCW